SRFFILEGNIPTDRRMVQASVLSFVTSCSSHQLRKCQNTPDLTSTTRRICKQLSGKHSTRTQMRESDGIDRRAHPVRSLGTIKANQRIETRKVGSREAQATEDGS